MKLILQSSLISRLPANMPPLGLLLPAGQTVCHNLTSATTLGTLFTSDDLLPTGFEVTDGEVTYGIDNAIEQGAWVDYATFERAESATLSGAIRLTNPSTDDIGITW